MTYPCDEHISIAIRAEETSPATSTRGKIENEFHWSATAISEDEITEKEASELTDAVATTGEYAHGVSLVEAWVFNEETGKIVRPAGGFWRDRFISLSEATDGSEDPSYPLPDPALPNMSNADIAVELWMESQSRSDRDRAKEGTCGPTLIWHDLRLVDPDQDMMRTGRTSLFLNAGLEKATGIQFSVNDTKGIVIFYSNEKAEMSGISRPDYELYMKLSAARIGHVLATAQARRSYIGLGLKRDKNADSGSHQHPPSSQTDTTSVISTTNDERNKFKPFSLLTMWLDKFQGGNHQPPTAMIWTEAIFTLVGSFLALAIFTSLAYFTEFIQISSISHLTGPVGALVALQFGTPASPAAQPRNVLYGQVVGCGIGHLSTYIPEEYLPLWLRMAIFPALAITAMSKLGVPHPPAGASAVVFSSIETDWLLYLCVILISAITTVPAILLNNISPRRQYPSYWHVLPARAEALLGCRTDAKKQVSGK